MRLELSPRMFQGIECRTCGGFMHDHETDCPQLKLEEFCVERARREYRCPKCHGDVALNCADFFECRKCRQQFATGPACGEDVEGLEAVYLLNDDSAIRAVVMTAKGRGKFRDDEIVKSLRRQVTTRRACRRSPNKP